MVTTRNPRKGEIIANSKSDWSSRVASGASLSFWNLRSRTFQTLISRMLNFVSWNVENAAFCKLGLARVLNLQTSYFEHANVTDFRRRASERSPWFEMDTPTQLNMSLWLNNETVFRRWNTTSVALWWFGDHWNPFKLTLTNRDTETFELPSNGN